MNKETYLNLMDCLRKQRVAIITKRNEYLTSESQKEFSEGLMNDWAEQLNKNTLATNELQAEYASLYGPSYGVDIYCDKMSALNSLKQEIASQHSFVMCYSCKDELLTSFATLLMDYSNHDKRDVEISLYEIEHGRIHWRLVADHEILDEGIYIIDKDVPF